MRVVWSAESVTRLKEIDEYLSEYSIDVADKWVDQIVSSGESLTHFSKKVRKVPEYDLDDYRELIVGNYRIIYTIKNSVVTIETIFESYRQLQRKK